MVVAVEPRLLGDTLARALERSGIDVVIHLDSGAVTASASVFDLALTTGVSLPDGVDADVIVHLPEGPSGDVVIERAGVYRTATIGGFTSLNGLIKDLLAGQGQHEDHAGT